MELYYVLFERFIVIFVGNQFLIEFSLEQGCSKRVGIQVWKQTGSFSLSCITAWILPTEAFPEAHRFHQRKPVLELHHQPYCFKFLLQPINSNEDQGALCFSSDEILWPMVHTTVMRGYL